MFWVSGRIFELLVSVNIQECHILQKTPETSFKVYCIDFTSWIRRAKGNRVGCSEGSDLCCIAIVEDVRVQATGKHLRSSCNPSICQILVENVFAFWIKVALSKVTLYGCLDAPDQYQQCNRLRRILDAYCANGRDLEAISLYHLSVG